jgi:hypothetical protein
VAVVGEEELRQQGQRLVEGGQELRQSRTERVAGEALVCRQQPGEEEEPPQPRLVLLGHLEEVWVGVVPARSADEPLPEKPPPGPRKAATEAVSAAEEEESHPPRC